MEDLLGSFLRTTVNQNGPKISPRGVEMPQLNAALMSALKCGVVRFTSQFFVLDRSKSISVCRGERDMETDEIGENHEIGLINLSDRRH